MGKHAGVEHRVCDAGDHVEQLIDQPGLARHVRGVRPMRGPLAQLHDVFKLGFPRRHGERHCALQHVRAERREVEGALGPPRRRPRAGRSRRDRRTTTSAPSLPPVVRCARPDCALTTARTGKPLARSSATRGVPTPPVEPVTRIQGLDEVAMTSASSLFDARRRRATVSAGRLFAIMFIGNEE